MGRDPLTARATADSSRQLATAERSIPPGVGCCSPPAVIRNSSLLKMRNGRPIVSYRRLFVLILLLFAGAAARRVQLVSAGDEWQPISQEELKMTSVPEAPEAPAIYLYRQVTKKNTHPPHNYTHPNTTIPTKKAPNNP